MKYKLITLLAAALVCGLLTGCLSAGQRSGLAEWQKSLADDHSNLDITLTTPWGTETIHRSNPYPPGTNAP